MADFQGENDRDGGDGRARAGAGGGAGVGAGEPLVRGGHLARWWSPLGGKGDREAGPQAGAAGGGGVDGEGEGGGEGGGGAGEGQMGGPPREPLVQCWLCPRRCVLGEQGVGFCGVRKVVDGKLISLVYGEISSIAVDPIEKKPLYHFLPGTRVFSIGTVGCTMDCIFCQNWQLSRGTRDQVRSRYLEPATLMDLALSHRCRSLAFTYNEPTVFGEYVVEAGALARRAGLKTVMVTNGYVSDGVIDELYAHVDGVNVDLKAMDPDFYRRCSRAAIGPVLNTIERLHAGGRVWLELTNLLIPGLNDGVDQVNHLCDWVLDHVGPDVPIHFSAFYPTYKATGYRHTPAEVVLRARNQALEKGIRFVYGGNLPSGAASETICPGCDQVVITRIGRQPRFSEGFNRETGVCSCGYSLPGVFAGAAPLP